MTRDRLADIRQLHQCAERDERAKDRVFEAVPELVAELERFYSAARPAVALESPFAGDVEKNTRFARLCLLDSLGRREAPFAGHLLYTQVLADASPTEREMGIMAHLTYVRRSERVVVYEDYGISSGMQRAIDLATKLGIPIEKRRFA